MPLIETKKALKEIGENESLQILIDNPTSAKNVTHFLNDNGISYSEQKNGDVIELLVNHTSADLEKVDETAYCSVDLPQSSSYVVFMSKDRIGEGSDELGEALAGAMLNTINTMESLPDKILFMNSGINLVVKDSLFIEPIKELKEKGVEIVVCGTCLDYFGRMDDLEVGRVSNMLDILESMKKASKVLNF